MRISFCVITRNEEKNVPELLANLAPVADEILIVDSGSTDKTVELARNGKARVLEHPWTDYTTQKNYALQEALHSWVFVLDADERLSPTLSQEIEGIKRAFPQEGGPERVDGFRINRLAHYWGRPIRHSGWYPDRKVRLFRKGTGPSRGNTFTRASPFGESSPKPFGATFFTTPTKTSPPIWPRSTSTAASELSG